MVKTSRSAGFTLAELVIVVLLIGILSVSVARPLLDLHRMKHIVMVEELIASLNYARVYALKSGCQVDIVFEEDLFRFYLGGKCLSADKQYDLLRPGLAEAYLVEVGRGLSVTINRVGQANVIDRFSFHPNGRACTSNVNEDTVITVKEGSGVLKALTISCGTGSILVESTI